MRAVAWAGGSDINDPGVKITLLTQQPLIDHVGHDVGDAPPVGLRGGVGSALNLALRQNVPQAEFHADLAAAQNLNIAGHHGLCAGHLPVLEIGGAGQHGSALKRSRPVNQPEQPATRQIVAYNTSHVVTKLGGGTVRPPKIRYSNRYRRRSRPADVDHRGLALTGSVRRWGDRLGKHRHRGSGQQSHRTGDQAAPAQSVMRQVDHSIIFQVWVFRD